MMDKIVVFMKVNSAVLGSEPWRGSRSWDDCSDLGTKEWEIKRVKSQHRNFPSGPVVKTLHFHCYGLRMLHSMAEKKRVSTGAFIQKLPTGHGSRTEMRGGLTASVTKRMMMLLAQTGKSKGLTFFFFWAGRRRSELPSGYKDFEVTEQKAVP